MENVNLYNQIKSIAESVDGSIWTRADLAYELKMSDSLDVTRLVWEAYNHFGKPRSIKEAFVNNDSECPLVDDYELRHLISTGQTENYFNALSADVKEGERALIDLDGMLQGQMSVTGTTVMAGLLSKLTGTSGIQEVRNDASKVVELYGKLVEGYENAKESVKEVAHDFVDLRTEILRIYEKYVMLLIDFFGDSVKSIAPELFDFESIEYLDTSAMFERIKLQYDELSENCSVLMGEISESFANSVRSVAQNSKQLGQSGALAMAAVSAISHYLDAQEKTTRMKSDLESLKMNVKRDVNNIKADYTRLQTVFKTINDLYIPKAHAYYRYSDKILSKEFENMVAGLYAKGGVAELEKERDAVVKELRVAMDEQIDHANNIEYYEQNIERYQHMLKDKEDDYQNAKAMQPTKPNAIVNLLTFGSAMSSYNKKAYEWNRVSGNLVREYERFKGEIELDSAELDSHRKAKDDLDREISAIRSRQKSLTKSILNKISVDQSMRSALAAHVEDIIAILHIGKAILESKLDARSIKAIHFDTYHSNELPVHLKEAVHNFSNAISEGYEEFKKDTSMDMVVSNGINLAETLINLQMQREQNMISIAKYDAQLKELQDDFGKQMANIDNQADIMLKILAQLNTAATPEEQKNAMLLLGKSCKAFKSEEEFSNFLNGKLNITI